ncbi:LysM peptidoglycan-binding domain-containing protein [Bacillus sp. DJP31]|uniref:C40 family peptidase n=1 Tax=Bacillus sp. DJP31 TaxID=3409789 RepID=UPI003BB50DDB
MIINHRIDQDGTILLYLDPSLTEFAQDLGQARSERKTTLQASIKEYISTRIPNANGNVIKVMLGSIVVTTLAFGGGTNQSAEASGTDSIVTQQSKYTVQAGDTLYSLAKKFATTTAQIKQENQLTSDAISIGQVLTIPTSTSTNIETTATYTVQSGDSLFSIAKKFGLTTDGIKQLNNLPNDMIFAGQTLKVSSQAAQSTNQTHTVQSGESLYGIAKKFGMSVDQLKQVNSLTNNMIFVGQSLKVTGVAKVSQGSTTYTVQSGDSLYALAKKHGITTTVLKQANHLTSDFLKVGQQLVIPGSVQAPAPAPAPAPEKQQEQSMDQLKLAIVEDSRNYVGVPYLWGGTTTSGFDCSGFLYYMFNKHDVDMPRITSGDYYQMGTTVSTANLEPGDLVFYAVNKPGVISHVGFYIGDNKFISATSSSGIAINSLDSSYWSKYYVGAKRVM